MMSNRDHRWLALLAGVIMFAVGAVIEARRRRGMVSDCTQDFSDVYWRQHRYVDGSKTILDGRSARMVRDLYRAWLANHSWNKHESDKTRSVIVILSVRLSIPFTLLTPTRFPDGRFLDCGSSYMRRR